MDNNVEVGKDSQEDEDGQRGNLWDYLAKTAGLLLAALEMSLGDIVVKVTSMMEWSRISFIEIRYSHCQTLKRLYLLTRCLKTLHFMAFTARVEKNHNI